VHSQPVDTLIVHLPVVHLSLRGVIVVMIEVVEAIGVGMVHPYPPGSTAEFGLLNE
jgi:hypothetical protein